MFDKFDCIMHNQNIVVYSFAIWGFWSLLHDIYKKYKTNLIKDDPENEPEPEKGSDKESESEEFVEVGVEEQNKLKRKKIN